MIFLPAAVDDNTYQKFTDREIHMDAGEYNLHGWRIISQEQKAKTIIYFGGNAEDVVHMNHEANRYNVGQLIAINYPGYGKSSGKPSQKTLYKSALLIYDQLIETYQLNAEDIIIVGRSLGSSVATYLAAQRPASALIIITPFDSMEQLASRLYRVFPVRYLLKHPFPTIDYIKLIHYPILMVSAQDDEIISQEHLINLQSAVKGNARSMSYSGVGHNTIQAHPNYYQDINQFIESIH